MLTFTLPADEEQKTNFADLLHADEFLQPKGLYRVILTILNQRIRLCFKKFSLRTVAIVFLIFFKWLSVELYYGVTRGKKFSFVSSYPGKWTTLGHEENTSEYGNSELLHIYICIWNNKPLWISTLLYVSPWALSHKFIDHSLTC